MSKSRLFRFVCLTLGWLAIASSASAQSSPKPLTVLTGIQLRELRLSDSTPDKFRANFYYLVQLGISARTKLVCRSG